MSALYTEADVRMALNAYFGLPVDDVWKDSLPAFQYMREVLDAISPLIAAKALRNLADEMDGGFIEWDDLRYKTTAAPKGWKEGAVRGAWWSMLLWAPYLRLRADEIEGKS